MARIIQKPLKMKDDVSVRTYPELVENFDLEKVFCYLKNGELERWLRSRQQEEKAKAINELNVSDEKVEKKICKILLPSDRVAFVQDELNDILDSSVQKIYLYGTEFTIPVDKENITYIGLNCPVVNVDSEKILDWKKVSSQLINCEFGNMGWSYNDSSAYKKEDSNAWAKDTKEEFMDRYISLCLKSIKEHGGIKCGDRFVRVITDANKQVADSIIQREDGTYYFDFEEKSYPIPKQNK